MRGKDKTGWIDRLKKKWNLDTASQVFLVLLIFALTGTTVFLIKRPILEAFSLADRHWGYSLAYYLLILPVYNVILLLYGALFGKFRFFWEFEKKMFRVKRRNKNFSEES
ncbi:MAG: prolipoprotein diacylglyceryl transferase [Cyclobacteriaceae bacterium]|nr:prolipoprotein diacylglyceryl transferase [Cyclobacteriaceae bacterium]